MKIKFTLFDEGPSILGLFVVLCLIIPTIVFFVMSVVFTNGWALVGWFLLGLYVAYLNGWLVIEKDTKE